MSKSRKILGALLAVVMVLSILSISAFAAENTSYEEVPSAYSQRWSLGQPVSQGGTTYKIEVNLTTTYPVGPVAFRLVGANVISVTGGTEYYSNPLTTQGDTGMVLMVPDTSATVPAHSVNGHIATVTYTTSNANGAVTLEKSAKTADSPNGTLVAGRCTAGTVNASDFVVGQYTYVNGELLNEVATQPADLALKAGTTGVVIDTHKTFGGQYAGVVYGFKQINNTTFKKAAYITDSLEATNGGSLVVTTSDGVAPNQAGMGNFGTGTTVKVLNSDGSVAKTYVICIFGDVDGNGLINVSDTQTTFAASGKATGFGNNSLKNLAANVAISTVGAVMHKIQVNDVQAINSYVGGKKFDTAAIAAAHQSFNVNYQ